MMEKNVNSGDFVPQNTLLSASVNAISFALFLLYIKEPDRDLPCPVPAMKCGFAFFIQKVIAGRPCDVPLLQRKMIVCQALNEPYLFMILSLSFMISGAYFFLRAFSIPL